MMELIIQPNPWRRISSIAARVGVKPIPPNGTGTICATGEDGELYDILDVLTGVLDKIDSANGQSRD